MSAILLLNYLKDGRVRVEDVAVLGGREPDPGWSVFEADGEAVRLDGLHADDVRLAERLLSRWRWPPEGVVRPPPEPIPDAAAGNLPYLSLENPTARQTRDQVRRLTRQVNDLLTRSES
jgi:hypothetical protein